MAKLSIATGQAMSTRKPLNVPIFSPIESWYWQTSPGLHSIRAQVWGMSGSLCGDSHDEQRRFRFLLQARFCRRNFSTRQPWRFSHHRQNDLSTPFSKIAGSNIVKREILIECGSKIDLLCTRDSLVGFTRIKCEIISVPNLVPMYSFLRPRVTVSRIPQFSHISPSFLTYPPVFSRIPQFEISS